MPPPPLGEAELDEELEELLDDDRERERDLGGALEVPRLSSRQERRS